MASLGVDYFKSLFKELKQVNMGEILKKIHLFQRIIKDEVNQDLYRVITKEELSSVIFIFRKDKIIGLMVEHEFF
jgi:hypothetical protein